MMLRDIPVLTEDGSCSDTLYIRGFPKSETEDSIVALLSLVSSPSSLDLTARSQTGQVWAKFANADAACCTLLKLHNRNVSGSVLSVKYELGLDEGGKRRVDKGTHTTIIRSISYRKQGPQPKLIGPCQFCGVVEGSLGKCNCAVSQQQQSSRAPAGKRKAQDNSPAGVSYRASSLFVGEMEYPFPTGLYLTRVIELCHQQATRSCSRYVSGTTGSGICSGGECSDMRDPLVALLTETRSMGNKYGKEVSEAMAMADAVQRALSRLPPALRRAVECGAPGARDASESAGTGSEAGLHGSSSNGSTAASSPLVEVYVLGDGCQPLTAACACLHLPGHFRFHSIDPLMRAEFRCATTSSSVAAATAVVEAEAVAASSTLNSTRSGEAFQSPQPTVAVPNPVFGAYSHRFFPLAMLSQEFTLPDSCSASRAQVLSIAVSCHSHAPLQEFWDRLPLPKVAVTMACCAGYAELQEAPLLAFEDFEVYSPKRTVKIYMQLQHSK